MRTRRTIVSGLVAGALALSLVAAETPPAPSSSGTASTRLLGAEVTVTGPFATPLTRVLDVDTSATTQGTPRAHSSVVPIELADGTTVGATEASSDGQASARSDGGTLGGPGGALGVQVSPVQTSATATADRALATVEAATGELSGLLVELGLDLHTAGITSLVSPDGASATQGMQVSGLALGLGDLGLDAELLATLGLDDILALLGALPGLLPSELADVTALFDRLEQLDLALDALPDAAAPARDSLAQLILVHDVLPDVEELDGLLATLTSLQGLDAAALLLALSDAELAGDLDGVGCPLPASLDLTNVEAALDDAIDCVTDELVVIQADLTAGGVDGLDGADPAGLLGTLTTLSTGLLEGLPDELDAVVSALDELTVLVEQLLALVEDLEGLLRQLPDLLADAAAMDLLTVGAFDVGTTAIAGNGLENSSATVLCDAVDVTVLGQGFATPDCSEALDGLPDVTGAVAAAVGELAGVLNTLPLGDLVEVGELRADLFTDVVEQVTETDGVVTATAGFNLLDLAVPSVTLDPSQVTSTLDGLALPDVMGPVDALLAELSGQLDVLGQYVDVSAPRTILADAEQDAAALAGVVQDELGPLLDTVVGLVDELGLGTLLDAVTTPGLTLLIDPVATATFQAVASDGTAAREPAPEPTPVTGVAPVTEPNLPTTGGGLALLGMLALAGAGSLRRRR